MLTQLLGSCSEHPALFWLQVPLRMLAITLPLGLSREETASTSVTVSSPELAS